jgi:hypothetical protein
MNPPQGLRMMKNMQIASPMNKPTASPIHQNFGFFVTTASIMPNSKPAPPVTGKQKTDSNSNNFNVHIAMLLFRSAISYYQ